MAEGVRAQGQEHPEMKRYPAAADCWSWFVVPDKVLWIWVNLDPELKQASMVLSYTQIQHFPTSSPTTLPDPQLHRTIPALSARA